MSVSSTSPAAALAQGTLLRATAGGGQSAFITSAQSIAGNDRLPMETGAQHATRLLRDDLARQSGDSPTKPTAQSDAREARLSRIEARMTNMRKALARLTGQTSGAETQLILYAGRGARSMSAAGSGQQAALYTSAGQDAVALSAAHIHDVNTGRGSDALAIVAEAVSDIQTDHDPRSAYDGGHDALAIRARVAQKLYTGAGQDALAVSAEALTEVDTGAGHDSLTLDVGLIGNLRTGSGDDSVTARLTLGRSQAARLAPGQSYEAGSTVTQRMQNARSAYADILTGDGRDSLAIEVSQIVSLEGGRGDDSFALSGGGTVGLRYGAGDGHDSVTLTPGTEALIEIDSALAKDWSVTRDGDSLTVRLGSGSIRFSGVTDLSAIGLAVTGQDGVTLLTAPQALDGRV